MSSPGGPSLWQPPTGSRPPRRSDPVSTAALVLALLGVLLLPAAVVGLVLGVVGLGRTGRDRSAGRGAAVAAVVVSGVTLLVTALLVLVLVATPAGRQWREDVATGFREARDAAAGVPAGQVPFEEVRVGDCLDDYLADEGAEDVVLYGAPVVDCAQPHALEVFALYDLPDGAYPGEDEVVGGAYAECGRLLDAAVGEAGVDASTLDVDFFRPTEESWELGDRGVICMLYDVEDGVLDPGRVLAP